MALKQHADGQVVDARFVEVWDAGEPAALFQAENIMITTPSVARAVPETSAGPVTRSVVYSSHFAPTYDPSALIAQASDSLGTEARLR